MENEIAMYRNRMELPSGMAQDHPTLRDLEKKCAPADPSGSRVFGIFLHRFNFSLMIY